jgi:LmbE family N-acetylglucosaminyl deacetylase
MVIRAAPQVMLVVALQRGSNRVGENSMLNGNPKLLGAWLLVSTSLASCAWQEQSADDAVSGVSRPLSCHEGDCAVMQVVAHEDDDILFMSPDLLRDVQMGRRIYTVYVTAGDAGLGRDYWLNRERGARAAYASMAAVADDWIQSSAGITGFAIPVFSLRARPEIQLAFLRLPDGCDGEGCARPGQSIEYLWRDQGRVRTVDRLSPSTYTRADLVRVLRQLMTNVGPGLLRLQNYIDPDTDGDHPDHHTAARFAFEAQQGLPSAPDVIAYLGYPTSSRAENVSGDELAAKQAAFAAYAAFDPLVCNNADCSMGIADAYVGWLARQYRVEASSTPIRVQGLDKCLDVRGPNSENGTPLQIWDCVGVANQNFALLANGELRGYADKCVDVRGPSSEDGTAVQIWDCVGAPNQQWQHDSSGQLVGFAGKCLQVQHAPDGNVSFANGTPVEIWECSDVPEQKWTR